jgi:hypothetical protein
METQEHLDKWLRSSINYYNKKSINYTIKAKIGSKPYDYDVMDVSDRVIKIILSSPIALTAPRFRHRL